MARKLLEQAKSYVLKDNVWITGKSFLSSYFSYHSCGRSGLPAHNANIKGSLHVKYKFILKCAKICSDMPAINICFPKINVSPVGSKPGLILSSL
jgi:hypothetical protein